MTDFSSDTTAAFEQALCTMLQTSGLHNFAKVEHCEFRMFGNPTDTNVVEALKTSKMAQQ